jgi:hypothetical protein
MRRFRILFIVAGAILLLVLLIGGAVFYFTRGAVDAADTFFTTIAESGPAAAYAQTAPAFRAATGPDDFANVAQRLQLTSFRSASWSSRSRNNDTAKLDGTLTLGVGGPLPITVDLVEDDSGTWRVLAFKIPPAGVQSDDTRPQMPDEAKQRQLAQVSVIQLIEAIKAKNFQALQASGATVFRQQFTVQALADQFKGFTDQNIDLVKFETNPVSFIQPPKLDGKGVLTLTGTLPTPVQPWYFEFSYLQDNGDWRMVSLSLSSHPD